MPSVRTIGDVVYVNSDEKTMRKTRRAVMRALIQAFFGDVENAVLPEDIAWRREDMDAHGENDDDPQGLQRLDDEFRRQAGNGEIQGHEGRDDGIGCQGMGKKDGDDEDHRSDDLDARIEFMQKDVPGKYWPKVISVSMALASFQAVKNSLCPFFDRPYPVVDGKAPALEILEDPVTGGTDTPASCRACC